MENYTSKNNLFPDEQELANAKVLIVDDEDANVRVLEWAFKQARFSNLQCLTDSTQAKDKFEQFQPDIVLLDLNMPQLDGFDVLEQLKDLVGPNDFVPVLMMTADTTAETRRRALTIGVHDFLNKPLDYSEVLLRVKNLLQTRYLFRQMREMLAQLAATGQVAK